MYKCNLAGRCWSGIRYQGLLFNLGRPLAQGATILGIQDKEYITHEGEMYKILIKWEMIRKF